MKRKVITILAVMLCCIMILSSCSNPLTSLRDFFNKTTEIANKEQLEDVETESLSEVSAAQPDNTRPTVMYYKDGDGLLVPVMRYVPKGDLGVAKSAVNALVYTKECADDLKPTGLLPTLPIGTKIIGAVIKENGQAIIDLSEEFLKFSSKEAEEIGVKSLVYTLTEFPNVSSVSIRVAGKTLEELPFGTKIGGALKRTEINLAKTENTGDKLSKVMVYYQKKGSGYYSYFVPVTKLVSGFKNSAEAALNALIQGPTADSGMKNPFPEGTKLLGVRVKDGIAYVDFSEEIMSVKENKNDERAMIKAVTLTLREFPVISKVKLFVNGTTMEGTEGIGANEYLDVPVFVNFYE